MSTKLGSLGIDDNMALKLQSALEKEFGVEFPARLLLPTAFVNELVTYTSLHVYNVDTSGTQTSSDGPRSPEFLEKEDEKRKQSLDKDGSQSSSAPKVPVDALSPSTTTSAPAPITSSPAPSPGPAASSPTKAK